jgi:hypothetical protein
MQRNQPPAVPFGFPGQVQNSFVFILNKNDQVIQQVTNPGTPEGMGCG